MRNTAVITIVLLATFIATTIAPVSAITAVYHYYAGRFATGIGSPLTPHGL